MTVTISVDEMIAAKSHFGHETSHWNPAMKKYIQGEAAGVHLFDLEQTAKMLTAALEFIGEMAKQGKTFLVVSTKPQSQTAVAEFAKKTGASVFTERWVGGFLTNFESVKQRVRYLKKLEDDLKSGELEKKYVKKERLQILRKLEKLKRDFNGVRELDKKPDVLILIDLPRDMVAAVEARSAGIPVVSLVDSNADPKLVDYPIPANDDAPASIAYFFGKFAEAVAMGRGRAPKDSKPAEGKSDAKKDDSVGKSK